MTPFDDFMFLINSILLGEEPVSCFFLYFYSYWRLLMKDFLTLDHRGLHTSCWYICCFHRIRPLVLFSNWSQRDWNSSCPLWRPPVYSLPESWWCGHRLIECDDVSKTHNHFLQVLHFLKKISTLYIQYCAKDWVWLICAFPAAVCEMLQSEHFQYCISLRDNSKSQNKCPLDQHDMSDNFLILSWSWTHVVRL